MFENTKNTVLAKSNALEMRGYGNWNLNKRIEVSREERTSEPFVCEVTHDIHNIRLAFTDLINDPHISMCLVD